MGGVARVYGSGLWSDDCDGRVGDAEGDEVRLGVCRIHLDIVLPRFPCEIISLDIQDAMMSHSPNLGSVHKYRLDRDGAEMDGGADF